MLFNLIRLNSTHQIQNAFFFQIKTTFKEDIVTTTLTHFVDNQLPDLVQGPGRDQQRSDNYVKYVDIQKHLKPLAYNRCQLHHMFLLHGQFFILDKAWLPQA